MDSEFPKYDNYETDPVEKLGLNHKTEHELLDTITSSAEWNPEDLDRIVAAYELASYLHRDDTYKQSPYIYHLLRVAARIVTYMKVYDADVVVAALLHDSVEDHPEYLIPTDVQLSLEKSNSKIQEAALEAIKENFGSRSAGIVKAVTNAPPGDKSLTYEEKLKIYAEKVEQATSSFDSWLVKFSDWCDNGLGIIHSELSPDSPQIKHFMRKYGGEVLRIYTKRFKEYRGNLDPEAANYVAMQLTLGYQRLDLELR